jgi:hypothetical protein
VCRRIFYIGGVELDGDALPDDAAGQDAPVFSLRAVAGMPICDTMQVRVTVGAASLTALLDTGATHNFIAEEAAHRTGLQAHSSPRMTATVANGERVTCAGVFRQAAIDIAGEVFHVDLYVMPLAGYDLVLGIQWLVTLGPIVWDFTKRSMSFTRQDRAVCWEDVTACAPPPLAAITSPTALLDELLAGIGGIFAEPTGLPPQRARDHSITLKPGALPVAVRPYRYPAAHKDELERQCAAMIEQGIVRRNDSAFSSPVVLVKKPDGSWRFCVDYRALNALTVKDAFPILVIDELLDELHGACFFTKLDLCSGYHQVRMRSADIHKTAFRTHDGLYEFLVMAFGLCNAPATFQALMNDVLRPFLRRFVLVFFDDILIYSRTWADHPRHIRAVFAELQRHQLFLKRSKCAFGAPSVADLGHVVSAAGVAMDPAKLQAVRDWPRPQSARAVRGFLGLSGYYRKFVHNYGTIAAPLTALLRKEGFSWTAEATAAFAAVKDAVTAAPVLAMPDFAKPFVVECDASSHEFGAVLVQDSHPIAFFSRPVAPRHRALAAYERADRPGARRPPLEAVPLGPPLRRQDRPLQPQVPAGPATVYYPPASLGGEAPRLRLRCGVQAGARKYCGRCPLRRDTPEDAGVMALSTPRFDFVARLRQAQATDPALLALHDEIRAGSRQLPWAIVDGLVQYGGRLYIPPAYEREYELRSRGPASLSHNALDTWFAFSACKKLQENQNIPTVIETST